MWQPAAGATNATQGMTQATQRGADTSQEVRPYAHFAVRLVIYPGVKIFQFAIQLIMYGTFPFCMLL